MVLENYAYRMLKSPAFTLLFLVLLTPSAAAERGSVVAQFPKWAAPQPDATKPFGGYELMNHSFTSEIYHASPQTFGTYNHNVMVGYLIGTGMVVQWKNCAIDEDCNGQRMLYSFSTDARKWSEPRVLFENMTTQYLQVTLEPGPPVYLNGNLYFASSPGFHNTTHDASAQGSQFCLWPDPVDKRNCGPPSKVAVQYNHTLLLRKLLPGGHGTFGPPFWASSTPPTAFAAATEALKILSLDEMDSDTRRDVALLSPNMPARDACGVPSNTGTLKCEACDGGCQVYASIDFGLKIANERTHWVVPGNSNTDVIVYRSEDHHLWASVRENSTSQDAWLPVQQTNIPNDNSNINAGVLSDGRVFLVHNPVTPVNGKSWARDPVTIATSRDGLEFDSVHVALTCQHLGGCMPRFAGHSKNPGPSYPQAIVLAPPAVEDMQGIYVVSSNNKEDIWITKLDMNVV